MDGGFERRYAMSRNDVYHEVYLNSWGSGKQLEVTFDLIVITTLIELGYIQTLTQRTVDISA